MTELDDFIDKFKQYCLEQGMDYDKMLADMIERTEVTDVTSGDLSPAEIYDIVNDILETINPPGS